MTASMSHRGGTGAGVGSAEAVPAGRLGSLGRRWRWVAFGAVITAAMMDLLDSTIAQVAAPTIRRELGGSYAVIEWVTAAYALAMAVGLLTGGRLGDIFGRRRVLLTGIAGFVVASAACAAAQSAGELIAARAAQGLLGAIMLPQVFGLIRDLFEAHEMGKAFGVYGPVMGLSAMLGPIASGGLISANVFGTGWRMIFLINVPVGLAALVLGARALPARSGADGARRGRLDLPGAALAGAGMFLLVFPLAQGHSLGWPGLAVRDAGRVRARAGRVRVVPDPPHAQRAATRWWSRPSSGTVRVCQRVGDSARANELKSSNTQLFFRV